MPDDVSPDEPIVDKSKWLCLRKGYDVYVDCADAAMCVPLTAEGNVIFIVEPDAMRGAGIIFTIGWH